MKKLPNAAPFWRERVKAANVVRCRQKWRRHFRVGVKPCWASQVGKNPERILETVQSSRIAGVKRNVLLYKGKNSKAQQKESLRNEAPFWRERGTDACRWIVDTTMLEQRKAYGCNKYPFYKNFPLPPRTSNLQPVFSV